MEYFFQMTIRGIIILFRKRGYSIPKPAYSINFALISFASIMIQASVFVDCFEQIELYHWEDYLHTPRTGISQLEGCRSDAFHGRRIHATVTPARMIRVAILR